MLRGGPNIGRPPPKEDGGNVETINWCDQCDPLRLEQAPAAIQMQLGAGRMFSRKEENVIHPVDPPPHEDTTIFAWPLGWRPHLPTHRRLFCVSSQVEESC